MVCMSCPPVSILHPLPRPKRVGIQIPPASYSPAPPYLLPTSLTNPFHLIPSVTWFRIFRWPSTLACHLLIYFVMPCPLPSILELNKMDNLLHLFISMTIKMIEHIYLCTVPLNIVLLLNYIYHINACIVSVEGK